jgi:hypothetical protein
MPMTYEEHEKRMKSPAVCELLPLRDLPEGDNVMIRTNGAFVAGYELRGILCRRSSGNVVYRPSAGIG